jgi:hypothetical protein
MVRIKGFTLDKLGDAGDGMEWVHIITTFKVSVNYQNARFINPGEGSSTGSTHYAVEMQEFGSKDHLELALTAFFKDKGYDSALGKLMLSYHYILSMLSYA